MQVSRWRDKANRDTPQAEWQPGVYRDLQRGIRRSGYRAWQQAGGGLLPESATT